MLQENVYNIDETGVIFSLLRLVKVFVSKDDLRDCRGASVKRPLVTAIECVSVSCEYLNPTIIWPNSTHRSSWRLALSRKQLTCADYYAA